MKNLYAVLGVTRAATAQELKAAYRAKAREFHPDRGGDAARFAELLSAYEVLADATRRAEWERQYATWAQQVRATLCGQCFAALRTRAGARNVCPLCRADVVAPPPSRLAQLRDEIHDRSADFLIQVGERLGQEIAQATETAVARSLQALQARLRGRR